MSRCPASLLENLSSRAIGFEADGIVHSVLKALLAAQISLCGFDGNVPEEKLNLLQFAAGLMAEAGTCPAQIVRGKIGQAAIGGSLFDDGPDHLWRGSEQYQSMNSRIA